jgi:signal transduction histidine kinase
VRQVASPDADLKAVLRGLLAYEVARGGFSDAAVLRFHPEREEDCLEPFVYQGPRLPVPWSPVPLALVDPALSGVGYALSERTSWRPDAPAAPHLPAVPGWDVPVSLVHPLIVDGTVFGALLLFGAGKVRLDLDQALCRQQVEAVLGRITLVPEAGPISRIREEARQDAQQLAQLTHELRTPLGLIKGYAATLENARTRLTEEEVDEFVHTILDQAERLEARVNDVLTMAVWDAHGVHVAPRLVRLSPWIEDVIPRFPPSERLRLQVEADAQIRVWADPEKLGDALTNLIQNAVKYSRGAIEVRAELVDGHVRITVRDHGPGVPERDLARIFERFYRSHRERPDMARGTGLGLSIARAVALAHHGSIRAENAPLGGLGVILDLPLADVEEGAPDA